MKKFIYITLAISTLLVSCRPEPIPIQLPATEGEIVVASQVIPNTTMIVALSRSFSALTPTDTGAGNDLLSQILVTRGLVTVSYDGRTDTLQPIAPGFYGTFTTPLKASITYSLNVYDSLTGKSVSAETRVEPRVFIDSAWVTMSVSGRDTSRKLYVRFDDPEGEQFYMMNVYRNSDFIAQSISNPLNIFRTTQNNVMTYPISDKLFSGTSYTNETNISGWFGKGDTLTVTLSSISRDYYTYLVQKQRAARNGMGAFFGEPVNYTTNVRNGLGFFTAHWPDFAQRILKE